MITEGGSLGHLLGSGPGFRGSLRRRFRCHCACCDGCGHATQQAVRGQALRCHHTRRRNALDGKVRKWRFQSHGTIETHGETPSHGYLEDYPWLGSEEMVIREDHPTDKWWRAMVSPSTRVIPFHLLNGMILPLVNDPRYRSSNGLSSSFNTSCCTSGSPVVHTSYFSGRMTDQVPTTWAPMPGFLARWELRSSIDPEVSAGMGRRHGKNHRLLPRWGSKKTGILMFEMLSGIFLGG